MLGLDFVIMIGALTFFFLRAAEDADRRERVEAAARAAPAARLQRTARSG